VSITSVSHLQRLAFGLVGVRVKFRARCPTACEGLQRLAGDALGGGGRGGVEGVGEKRGGREGAGALGGALGGAPPYALEGERGLCWRLVVGACGEVMQLLHRRPIRCG